MEFKNSYIFLKREKEKKKIKKNSKENVIVVSLPPSFKQLLEKCFHDINFDNRDEKFTFIKTGLFKIDYNNTQKEVFFKYHNVWSNYYLDIIVKTRNKQDAINILNLVNSKLIDSKNVFEQDFISIVSYDYVSEYYCNKLFPYLNEFERKLRKILFVVYTLNFNLEYYSATTSEDFQANLKQKANSQKTENISKKDCYIKLGFYSLDYHDIETLLFSKSITPQETKKVQDFLNENEDLSKLSDSEIRKAFELCNYKSDWERFFGDKKIEDDFQIIFNDIRVFRNNIAHCKFISETQYKNCLEILEKTNKSLDMAIKITEEKDFIYKNIELQQESFERLAKTMRETVKPILENINLITQPLKEFSEKLNEIVNPISKMIPNIVNVIPKVEMPNFDLPNIVLPEIELPKFDLPNYFNNEINDEENVEENK